MITNMGRLPGFDYKKPSFYMVTVKRAAGGEAAIPPFSRLEAPGVLADTALTPALRAVVDRFHETWWCIEPIRYYAIMPDHLHLLIKLREVEGRVSLAVVVRQLLKALERAAGGDSAKPVLQSAAPQPVFEKTWHDWIVKKEGQFAAFRRYIAENPERAWRRHENRRFFTEVQRIGFAGREWFAYGNVALLDLPVIEPCQCSRKWAKGGKEWCAALAKAGRIGPGGAGIGTFMSPCEKECGNAIFKSGGGLIMLAPEGFGER